MSYANNRKKVFYALVVKMFLVFVQAESFSGELMRTDVRAELNIYAAHYAGKGYLRMGSSGYGKFLDFTFGQTNTCWKEAVEKMVGTNRVWLVLKKMTKPYRGFCDVALHYDVHSCRLFKIVISRNFGSETDIGVIRNTLKACSQDCDNWLGICVPVTFSGNCADETQNNSVEGECLWNSRMEDTMFGIDFDAYRLTEGVIRVDIAVESKRVRQRRLGVDGRNEIKVQLNDL